MPVVMVMGYQKDTPQERLDEMEAAVKEATASALSCPQDWVTVVGIPNAFSAPQKTIWVLAGTGIFETRPFLQSETEAHNLSLTLCPVIHQALGFDQGTKVETFPLPLPLHLHAIYPDKKKD